MSEETINVGDYIIIQRQLYTKLHKLKLNDVVILGKDNIELKNIVSKRYSTMFQMTLKTNSKRVYTLQETDRVSSVTDLCIEQKGTDNRSITDDGSSQLLTTQEICKFRDEALASTDIVEKLIENSTTFNSKTEYSQEKYLKKKEKKYFEYIQIHKPSIRLLAEMYFRQDPAKVLGMRIDDLSQILYYSNVQSEGTYMLYESGTGGLPVAAFLERIGEQTEGYLIHIHQGNEAQKQSLYALKFPEEQFKRCISVNIYSVLRWYYQKFLKRDSSELKKDVDLKEIENVVTKVDVDLKEIENEVKNTDVDLKETEVEVKKDVELINENGNTVKVSRKRKISETDLKTWQKENQRACEIIHNKVDSLVVIAKEHPLSIVNELAEFLNIGKPLVVFSTVIEVLQELYVELKKRSDFTALRLTETFLRNYQVLESRTHPEVNMTNGGYILFGYKVDPELSE